MLTYWTRFRCNRQFSINAATCTTSRTKTEQNKVKSSWILIPNRHGCTFNPKCHLRVRFGGNIQIRILESENRFCVLLLKSKNGSWIQRIHTSSGFFRSNLKLDFWDSWSQHFFGKGFEESASDERSSVQIYLSRHIFARGTETSVVYSLRIIGKFSSEVQHETKPLQGNFICVPFLLIQGLILKILDTKACLYLTCIQFQSNSKALLDQRNTVLTSILRASILFCHNKIILFRIFCFIGGKESVWSGITNPFLDSPKKAHP